MFERLVRDDRIVLSYVSGRDKRLLLQAIDEYQIPVPDYAIGDVGTTIYQISNNNWTELDSWATHISEDWHGVTVDEIGGYLRGLNVLTLQENEKQNRFKLSYYAPADIDVAELMQSLEGICAKHTIKASLIWSIDEIRNVGLLDILPASANKLHAIEFLIAELGMTRSQAVFAGDSGNDLQVVVSDIPSVLVRNASSEIKRAAGITAHPGGINDTVYIAKGGFHGLNGNYSAGVLEGVVHYHPCLEGVIKS